MMKQTALRLHSLHEKVKVATGAPKKGSSMPIVVGVCGGSGSGKTSFCRQVVETLGESAVVVLRQDDYYKDLSHLSESERARVNFDHPDSIEFELLNAHLDMLMSGFEVAVPVYDFTKHTRKPSQIVVSPRPFILVEGILLFADPGCTSRIQHKIYIDAPETVRFQRRLERDTKERGRTPDSVKSQYSSTVRPMHDEFVEPSKAIADRVVSGEEPFAPIISDICSSLLEPFPSPKHGIHHVAGSRKPLFC